MGFRTIRETFKHWSFWSASCKCLLVVRLRFNIIGGQMDTVTHSSTPDNTWALSGSVLVETDFIPTALTGQFSKQALAADSAAQAKLVVQGHVSACSATDGFGTHSRFFFTGQGSFYTMLPLPVLDGLAVCRPAGRGFRYFPCVVVSIDAKSHALTFMNIDQNVLLEISY